jgi:ABC-type Fe3+-hydroxamate transport system substrate-binding protein
MKKFLVLILFLAFCSSGTDSTSEESVQSAAVSNVDELVYEDTNGTLVNVDLTNKKTLVVFWADY